MVFTPGMRLADRYRLVARIGLGGMSEVWRASDDLLDRPVAVKALASPLATDPTLRAGIRREATAAARLTHPNVTHVYDYGEVSIDGGPPMPYLVMELVVGENLADLLSRGPLPWRDAVRVGAQVAAGLAAAHRLGVVHRDVKPGNVMLTATGAKILDFGIAVLAAQPEAAAGPLIGTPAYVAPERLIGAAGPPGDVYSLGALLYEALTGRKALAVNSWEEAAVAHRAGVRPEPPQVPGLPGEVVALCMACLASEPADRPEMNEVAARMAAVLGTPDASPAGSARPARTTLPPTLIDRSGIGSRGARGTSRVAAQAPVVRPAPLPAEPVPARGGDRSRLTVLAASGIVIAAALTLTLVAAANQESSSDAAGATQPSVAIQTPSSEPTTSRPTPQATAGTGEGIAAEFDRFLDEAVAAGLMNAEVADDLRDRLTDIRKELGKRRLNRKKLSKKAADLREAIRKHTEEGRINRDTAARLEWLLRPLINDGEGNHEDDD